MSSRSVAGHEHLVAEQAVRPGRRPVPKVPIEVAVVDGKPLATRRVAGEVRAQERRVPGPAHEQVVAQPVDEHGDRAPGGGRSNPGVGRGSGALRPTATPRLRATLGSTSASAGPGPTGGCADGSPVGGIRPAQPWPMAADRSRAKSRACESASSPSAAAEMRSAMSSPVMVPS